MENIINNTKRKTIIVRIGVGLFIMLTLLTFLSKTINGILIPKVTITTVVKGTLQEKFEEEGTIEIKNKYQIISDTNWKVKKVISKVNQRVKKGDVLFTVDNADIELSLKKEELEILKLENAIENEKLNSIPNQLSGLENEVRMAKADVDYSKKKLVNVKKLLDIGAETQSNYDAAEKEYNEYLYTYQAKQKQYDEKTSELNNDSSRQDRSLKEKMAELEVKKVEYNKVKKSMPVNGCILSDRDGIVTAINIEEGMTTVPNQTIIEIVDENCEYNVVWYSDMDKAANYDIGQKITATVKSFGQTTENKEDEQEDGLNSDAIKDYNFSLKVCSKEIIHDKGQIKFYANINDEQRKKYGVSLCDNQKTNILATKNSTFYNNIIPKSCITEIDGKNYVFVVKTKKGALGIENVVEQRKVEVIEEDIFKIAVNGSLRDGDSIVSDTTKPLSNNMRVGVR